MSIIGYSFMSFRRFPNLNIAEHNVIFLWRHLTFQTIKGKFLLKASTMRPCRTSIISIGFNQNFFL